MTVLIVALESFLVHTVQLRASIVCMACMLLGKVCLPVLDVSLADSNRLKESHHVVYVRQASLLLSLISTNARFAFRGSIITTGNAPIATIVQQVYTNQKKVN